MRKTFMLAAACVAVLVAGVAIFATSGGDDSRKASIGSGDSKPKMPPAPQVDSNDAPERLAGVVAKAVTPATTLTLKALQSNIAAYVEQNGTDNSFSSFIDATTAKIVLTTDASDDVIAKITQLDSPAQQAVMAQARIEKGVTITDVWHRRDDVPSFWGGAGITNGSGICSSGYAARRSSGQVVSVTAGHCFANGQTAMTESNARSYGTVSDRRLASVTGHPMDFELVSGSSYAGRIYTGGVTSTSSIPVVAAGSAFAGYSNYCHSGRTTGQSCGHTANSTTGQVCTQSGCKSPVIVFTGGNMIQGGDSGGTFYAADSSGAWIRGNTIASGGGTGYAQPWTTIANELNLTIVTG